MRRHFYTIEWTSRAQKQFRKITDEKLKQRIIEIIENEIASDPLIGKPLTLGFKGIRSYRIGRLRILYKPYKAKLIIVILRIEHRKSVYRKRI